MKILSQKAKKHYLKIKTIVMSIFFHLEKMLSCLKWDEATGGQNL